MIIIKNLNLFILGIQYRSKEWKELSVIYCNIFLLLNNLLEWEYKYHWLSSAFWCYIYSKKIQVHHQVKCIDIMLNSFVIYLKNFFCLIHHNQKNLNCNMVYLIKNRKFLFHLWFHFLVHWKIKLSFDSLSIPQTPKFHDLYRVNGNFVHCQRR
jgi:hypothetical protein